MKTLFHRILQIIGLIVPFVLIVYIINKPLFNSSQDSFTLNKTDLPLSRCTVDFDYRIFKDAVNDSNWAKLDGRTLEVKDKNFAGVYNELVNKNDMAEIIASEYPDIFNWDPEACTFKMPRSDGYITVPTWILYEFIDKFHYDK